MGSQARRRHYALVIAGLPVLLVLAQSASAQVPPPQQQAPAPATTAPAADSAASNACPAPNPESQTIVICTQRPQGYRLNPDVMEAKREAHSPGRPVRPGGSERPQCATVGPFPCFQPGINLLSAAATAAEMAKRAASGQDVGSMFETDPQTDEYHLYLQAKARREAAEAQKAAKAAAARAAASKSAVPQPQPAPQPAGN